MHNFDAANMAALSEEEGGQAELGRLLSWFETRGGSVSKVCLEDLGGDMSLSIVTREAVKKGDVVMSIPISLCMTVESVSVCGCTCCYCRRWLPVDT